jgi:hypothetical protein
MEVELKFQNSLVFEYSEYKSVELEAQILNFSMTTFQTYLTVEIIDVKKWLVYIMGPVH